MSDLGAIVKGVARSVVRGAEKGGKSVVEHYSGIGRRLLESSNLHRQVEDDMKRSIEGIGRGGAKDLEHDAGQAGKNAAKDAGQGARGWVRRGLDRVFGRRGAHDGVAGRPSGGDPVDLATGDVLLAETDVTLPGVLPLVLERTHRSSMDTGRWFGPSWMSSLDQRLLVTPGRVIGAFADGRVLNWTHPNGSADAAIAPVTGPMWPLRRDPDGSYSVHDPQRGLTWRFGHREGYETTGGEGAELPLVSVTDRIGHEIAFGYDTAGRPLSVTHSGGYRVHVSVTDDRVTALTLAGGDGGDDGGDDVPLRQFEYDDDGNLSGVVNSSGLPMRFTYDAGRMTSWTDRNGHSYRYTYDDQGRCVRGDGPDGALSGTFAYEPGITRWTDADGAVTTYEITDSGRIAAATDPLGNTTRWEYDERGRVITEIDPLGQITRYAHNDWGDVTAIIRPDGARATAEYDERSLPVLLTEPDGSTWRQDYDERGNPAVLVAPDGGVTRYGYDGNGHLTSVTDPAGAIVEFSVNAAGLPVAIASPEGGWTRYDRDASGLITRVTNPDGAVTSVSWTPEGQLGTRTFPDGATERWVYDAEGNLSSYLNAVGGVSTYEYGPFDRLTAMSRPDGMRTELGYDHQLRLTSVIYGGLTWRYKYDTAGRMVAETDYNDATMRYEYDAAGQVISKVNAAGQQVTFSYDNLGNLTRQTAEGIVTRFDHDVLGRLVGAENPDASLRFERDQMGRATAQTCNGQTVATSYDAMGRLLRRVTPAGSEARWQYNLDGQPLSLSADGHEIHFGYDQGGREIRRDLPGGLTLAQGWDQRGRLVLQKLTGAVRPSPQTPDADSVLQRRAYDYRADGLVVGIADVLSGDRRMGLDRTGRVTTVTGQDWTEQYSYDPAGNMTAGSWPGLASVVADVRHDAEAQGQREVTGTLVKRAGNIRYRYDRQGRVIQRQRIRISRKPETWRYEWDGDDRLTLLTTPDGTKWRYLYDPLGRRIAKERVSAEGRIVERTTFAWDGSAVVEESRNVETHDQITTWDYRPGTFAPIAQRERTSAREGPQDEIDQRFYAIITDLVGSPAELVAPDGTIANRQRGTLWGLTTWDTDVASTPLRFPGQYEDPETGLHYNNQRYYDPVTGSYLSPDPLGLTPAPNAHAYVPNPQILTDPLGLAHYCDMHAYDEKGEFIGSMSLKSGDGTPGERSLSPGNSRWVTDTESRGLRAAGYPAKIHPPLDSDPYYRALPVPEGGHVVFTGKLPPCPRCMGAMRQASNKIHITYRWPAGDDPDVSGYHVWQPHMRRFW